MPDQADRFTDNSELRDGLQQRLRSPQTRMACKGRAWHAVTHGRAVLERFKISYVQSGVPAHLSNNLHLCKVTH